MNALKIGYFHRFNFYCLRQNIKQFFRNLKYAWQRITRGYCDADLWDLNDYYCTLIENSLRDFNQRRHGYPIGLEEEEWNTKIQHIVQLLNKYRVASANEMEAIEDEYSDKLEKTRRVEELSDGSKQVQYEDSILLNEFTEAMTEINKKRNEIRHQAFAELDEILDDLWD